MLLVSSRGTYESFLNLTHQSVRTYITIYKFLRKKYLNWRLVLHYNCSHAKEPKHLQLLEGDGSETKVGFFLFSFAMS